MATKHTDGCFQHAEDDEPLFTLLARDATAPQLVEQWADQRQERDGETDQVQEARQCAGLMREWRQIHRPDLHVFIGTREGEGDYVVAADECGAAQVLFQVTGDPEMVAETKWQQWPDDQPFGMTEIDEPGHPLAERPVDYWIRAGRRYLGGYA